eukprot:6098864-Alexandrium_andersonii.AAC.1
MRANRGLTVGAGDHLRGSEGRGHGAPNPSEGALDARNAHAPLTQSGLPEAGEVGAERGLSVLPERAPRIVLPKSHGAHVGSEGAEAGAEARRKGAALAGQEAGLLGAPDAPTEPTLLR